MIEKHRAMGPIQANPASDSRASKNALVVLFIILLVLVGLQTAQAQEPTFHSGLLTLPVLDKDGEIFRLTYGLWEEMPGLRKDIGIGADGSVWVVGSNERAGGYGIYYWNSIDWEKLSDSARQISVGPNGSPWVVNRDGKIYTRRLYFNVYFCKKYLLFVNISRPDNIF